MDTSVSPDAPIDEASDNVEFPVSVDTLMVGGTAPSVGDTVDVKVGGTVTRVVNKIAYVKPDTVNDQPLPAPPLEPNPQVNEMDRLRNLSKQYGRPGEPVTNAPSTGY